jgi:AcrR family transcriptional regulator
MTTGTPSPPPATRRDELLELAAEMFAERGLRATTVRDIADAAGILSGSLYHHFSSKEEMVDEALRSFLDWGLAEKAQAQAAQLGYVPLQGGVLAKARAAVARIVD